MKLNNDYCDVNIDDKYNDENNNRVSGNEVLVPPGVVEDEGIHAIDKHLQPVVRRKRSHYCHLLKKVGSILLVEVEEHLAVTVCGEGDLRVGDTEEQYGFTLWAVIIFLKTMMMTMAMVMMMVFTL